MCYHPPGESDLCWQNTVDIIGESVGVVRGWAPGHPDVCWMLLQAFSKLFGQTLPFMRDPPACPENVPGAVSSFRLTPPQNRIHMLFLFSLIGWRGILCMKTASLSPKSSANAGEDAACGRRRLHAAPIESSRRCSDADFYQWNLSDRVATSTDGPGSHRSAFCRFRHKKRPKKKHGGIHFIICSSFI